MKSIVSIVVSLLLHTATGFHCQAQSNVGFILKRGEGESLLNGIVIKASPKTGTERSIMAEQTFPKGGTTNLHIHEQGDELFYVVSGKGMATLGDNTEEIGHGDVIFVPKGAVHVIQNLNYDEPLKVVFLWKALSW